LSQPCVCGWARCCFGCDGAQVSTKSHRWSSNHAGTATFVLGASSGARFAHCAGPPSNTATRSRARVGGVHRPPPQQQRRHRWRRRRRTSRPHGHRRRSPFRTQRVVPLKLTLVSDRASRLAPTLLRTLTLTLTQTQALALAREPDNPTPHLTPQTPHFIFHPPSRCTPPPSRCTPHTHTCKTYALIVTCSMNSRAVQHTTCNTTCNIPHAANHTQHTN
jgi:hypothetical protein